MEVLSGARSRARVRGIVAWWLCPSSSSLVPRQKSSYTSSITCSLCPRLAFPTRGLARGGTAASRDRGGRVGGAGAGWNGGIEGGGWGLGPGGNAGLRGGAGGGLTAGKAGLGGGRAGA